MMFKIISSEDRTALERGEVGAREPGNGEVEEGEVLAFLAATTDPARARAAALMPQVRESHEADPEKLQADQELYALLSRDDFKGRYMEQLHHDLWAYGWRVSRAWMKDSSIFARCARRGVRMKGAASDAAHDLTRRGQTRDDVAADTLSRALPAFIEALKAGSWDPNAERAATLRTFFIGQVLYHFRDAFYAHVREHLKELRFRADLLPTADRPSATPGGPERMELRDQLREILQDATPAARAICGLIYAEGATQVEIAETLGLSRCCRSGCVGCVSNWGSRSGGRGGVGA